MKFPSSILLLAPLALGHVFEETQIVAPFLEQFNAGWETRWMVSTAKKTIDGVEDEDLLQYRGIWSVEAPLDVVIEGDQGLVLKTAKAHHAISSVFKAPLSVNDEPLVVQYEVKLQNGLECGGAYMKLLSADSEFEPAKFGDKTPYTIMFGPDKCGSNNKVHFIFRHLNPITQEFEEKHLKAAPKAVTNTKTNLYTLVVSPDQTFEILINNESVSKGSLLEDFTPAVNPAKEINDPIDTKPADWVNEAKISDPEATKPEEWDEEAPFEIVNDAAVKPEGWLDDAPATIADPSIAMPEDWNEEEDGDWVAPEVPNPACEVAGCGPWTKPMMKNPLYKGKWTAPLIDNPAYIGEWAPKKIANPDYFEDLKPSRFTPIGAVGFELWTLQDGFVFDNIYVGHSLTDAQKLAAESWEIKYKNEKTPEPPVAKKTESYLEYAQTLLMTLKEELSEFMSMAQVNPIDAIKGKPVAASIMTLLSFTPFLLFNLTSGKKAKKVVAEPKEEEEEEEESIQNPVEAAKDE